MSPFMSPNKQVSVQIALSTVAQVQCHMPGAIFGHMLVDKNSVPKHFLLKVVRGISELMKKATFFVSLSDRHSLCLIWETGLRHSIPLTFFVAY